MGISALDLLDVSQALLAEGAGAEGAARLAETLDEPLSHTDETWGTSPQAQAEQRAMMGLAGGPAPMRAQAPAPTAGATPGDNR